MITNDDDKGDDKKLNGQSKNEFKIQEESWFQESKIKIQEIKIQEKD